MKTKTGNSKSASLSIRLTPEVDQYLRDLAAQRGETVSKVIGDYLSLLSGEPQKKAQHLLDVMREYAEQHKKIWDEVQRYEKGTQEGSKLLEMAIRNYSLVKEAYIDTNAKTEAMKIVMEGRKAGKLMAVK